MTTTSQFKRYAVSNPVGVFAFQTLQLDHPKFLKTYYITNNVEKVTAKIEDKSTIEFIAVPFAVKLPTKDSSGRQDLQIQIDNIDKQIIKELERASEDFSTPITVVFREFTSDHLEEPANNPLTLKVTDVEVDMKVASMTASRFDVLNRAFPAMLYTVDKFPGLDR